MALARTGKIYLKVDRPEIRQLQWLAARPTGQPPVWQQARWTSSGFEIDLGESDALHIEVTASAPMQGPPGWVADWYLRERIAVTSDLLPAVYAEPRVNWGRLALVITVPLAAYWWVRRFRRVAGYRLGPLLGRGGSGEVYRGQRGLRPVAIKRMRAGHAEERQRLAREVETCRRLQHPHIVSLLDAGPDYLVMELMTGGSLRARLGSPYSPLQALELLAPIFGAVQYAHERGVIHLDLKPENILFDEQGHPKIADFGLARHPDNQTLTQEGLIQGSPAYMAPEQIQGATRDPRIDQYALGIISFQVLAGKLPFEAPWFEKHLRHSPPSLCQQAGPQVNAVLQRMLEKLPELRYPSVAEAWEALRRALAQGDSDSGWDEDETGVSSSS